LTLRIRAKRRAKTLRAAEEKEEFRAKDVGPGGAVPNSLRVFRRNAAEARKTRGPRPVCDARFSARAAAGLVGSCRASGELLLFTFDSDNINNSGSIAATITAPAAVPLPAAGLLLVGALGGLGALRRRKV
jgi:hypothetical protein